MIIVFIIVIIVAIIITVAYSCHDDDHHHHDHHRHQQQQQQQVCIIIIKTVKRTRFVWKHQHQIFHNAPKTPKSYKTPFTHIYIYIHIYIHIYICRRPFIRIFLLPFSFGPCISAWSKKKIREGLACFFGFAGGLVGGVGKGPQTIGVPTNLVHGPRFNDESMGWVNVPWPIGSMWLVYEATWKP